VTNRLYERSSRLPRYHDIRVIASKIRMNFRGLTEGCSPLTFCNCLFCGPAVGVRGSTLPALLAPLPGAAVAPATPLAGPPLPPAGDLLEGLPVVLKKKDANSSHYIIHVRIHFRYDNFFFPLLISSITFKQSVIAGSPGTALKRHRRHLTMFIRFISLQSLIIVTKRFRFQIFMQIFFTDMHKICKFANMQICKYAQINIHFNETNLFLLFSNLFFKKI